MTISKQMREISTRLESDLKIDKIWVKHRQNEKYELRLIKLRNFNFLTS